MSNISYYKNAYDKQGFKQPITLNSFLLGIKEGKHRTHADRIRQLVKDGAPKPEIRRAKTELPSAAISGVFSYCENDKLTKHSGYIAIDIDADDNPELADNLPWWKNNLAADDYTYSVFESITGTGLCIIVKIDPGYHRESFRGLQQYYLENYEIKVDGQCINEARVRFTSWDPDLVINEDSEVCDMIIEEEPKPEKVNTVESDKLEPLLKYIEDNQIDITASYNDWYYVGMSLATVYGEGGRDYYHRISQFHQNYDHSSTDKKFDNFLTTSMGRLTLGTLCYTLKKYDVPWRDLVPQSKETQAEDQFFYAIKDAEGNIKKDNKGSKIFTIDRVKFIEFLSNNGFCKHYPNDDFEFIRIQKNIVSRVTTTRIQDFVTDYIKAMPEVVYTVKGGDSDEYAQIITKSELLNKLLSGISIFFAEKLLTTLPTVNIIKSPVSRETDYFNFKNGVVKITKGKATMLDYSKIEWHVWDTQIINRNINLDLDQDFEQCQWAQFLKLLSHVTYEAVPHEKDRNIMAQQRLYSIMSITGYLLHSYKDPSNARAVLLMDQNDTENPEGGTGKGLFSKGIAQIKNSVIIDGKNFSFDKEFAWQRIDVDTQIVVMDDVPPKFPFERMFSLVTDGWPIRKLFQKEIYLQPNESPKVLMLNNYVPDGEGNSFERRLISFELGRFFGPDNTPESHFNNILFHDWDADEWNRFDNFMIFCLEYYLNNGIIEAEQITISLRKLEQNVPAEVVEFFNEFIQMKTNGSFFKTSEVLRDLRQECNNFNNLTSKKLGLWIRHFNGSNVAKGKLLPDRNENIRGYKIEKE